MKRGTLNRDVTPEECVWLRETIKSGTVVHTRPDIYGVADDTGILITVEGEDRGQQVPHDAVTWDDGEAPVPRRSFVAPAIEIAKATELAGTFDTSILLPGAKLEVNTSNSQYIFEFVDPKAGKVKLKGGKRWPDYVDAKLVGSTWGGSMLWSGKLGIGMCMEINVDNKTRTTSPVVSIKVPSE